MRRISIMSVVTIVAAGCASLAKEDDHQLKITDTSETQFAPVDYTDSAGFADYKLGDQTQRAEWLVCRPKSTVATILVMHTDRAGYDKGKFCGGWIAQTFLSQGLTVLTVNRPGYGTSSGAPDFTGAQSLAAIDAAVTHAVATAKIAPPKGIWGYSTGAMAAALASRRVKGLEFMIIGGGVYDLEDTLKKTTDSYLKQDIETIKRTGGDKAIEDRSVAYDVSGLPKRIMLYHGKQDTAVPQTQAKAFSDSLESSGEYKVQLQVIEGLAHEIPWRHHRKILEVLTVSVLKSK